MSVKIMSDVFENSKTVGNTRLVLLCLADCANDEGACWPSIRKIAQKANLSEPMTKKHLNALIATGVVRREEREDHSGRQTSNFYTVDVAKIGDDEIGRDVWEQVTPVSRQHKFGGVIEVSGRGGNSGQGVVGVTEVSLSYMNHQKEPSKEPSHGFVADAPKTMNDDLFPNNSTNESAMIAERSSMDSRPKSAIPNKLAAFQTRANGLLGRRPATKWAANEIKAAANWLDTTDEEWELLEGYYANRGQDGYFCRKTMITLLNNWSSEIDKARSKQPVKPKQTCPDEKEDPEGFNAFWASVKPNE